MGFLIRWALALVLVVLTFNPTQWNYVHWSFANFSGNLPMVVLLGLLLLVAYIIFLRATLRSIGTFGMALIVAILAALLWVLYDRGWLTLDNASFNIWLGDIALSLVLGVGLSWSHIRRTLSGQSDMDDVSD